MLRSFPFASILLSALLLTGCPPSTSADAGVPDGGAARTQPCLERPTDLPRPPGAEGLPCDLLPPGFAR
jgi:hypothetical protein